MKGQERLDRCIASGLIKLGTRFLYRNHGIATGQLWEGTMLERILDSEDGNRAYVRLDESSGEWELPENIFVELIFPAPGAKPAPVTSPAATATSAPAGRYNLAPNPPNRAADAGEQVPIQHKTKTPKIK